MQELRISLIQTANTIPNIVFDIVAGGVLAALVVAILAPYFATANREELSRTVSALISWALLVLIPIALLIVVAAAPLARLFLGTRPCPEARALGTRMLLVFAPQVVFYGLSVIFTGTLQAAERFSWPALAPLLSTLVVISAYLVYGVLAGPGHSALGLSRGEEYLLTIGTTLGVVVLACCQLPVLRRTGIRFRPTLRLPTELAPTVRAGAIGGVATLAAQQLSSAVMIRLANQDTPVGTVVIATLAQTVFLLPWAVLAVLIATSAFPRLSAQWNSGRTDEFRRLSGSSTKVVIALAGIGTAALIAAAEPVGNVLLRRGSPSHAQLAPAIAVFAIGLIGWSLVALLARMLYAAWRVTAAAAAQVAGQVVVIIFDVMLALLLPADRRAVAMAAGNVIGVCVAAALLLVVTRRHGLLARLRTPAFDLLRCAPAAAFGAAVGWLIGRRAEGQSALVSLGLGVLAAAVAIAAAAVVIAFLDRDAGRAVLARVRP